jgi:hypothetical protein
MTADQPAPGPGPSPAPWIDDGPGTRRTDAAGVTYEMTDGNGWKVIGKYNGTCVHCGTPREECSPVPGEFCCPDCLHFTADWDGYRTSELCPECGAAKWPDEPCPEADNHGAGPIVSEGVICTHDSWAGLMALLDDHWPADVFPTRDDDPARDPGPRIVSLLRVVDGLRQQRERYLTVADELIQRAVDAETPEVATAYHYAAGRIIGGHADQSD